jgi:hypothetical protein
MNLDLYKTCEQLREAADANIIARPRGDSVEVLRDAMHRDKQTEVHHMGQKYWLRLNRIMLDPVHGISTYVLFIASLATLSDEACAEICRAVYSVDWPEGPCLPFQPPGMRWFLYARVEGTKNKNTKQL